MVKQFMHYVFIQESEIDSQSDSHLLMLINVIFHTFLIFLQSRHLTKVLNVRPDKNPLKNHFLNLLSVWNVPVHQASRCTVI